MLSKTQFVSLVDGMKKQSIFEQKVSTAFDMLNSSFTVLDLAATLECAVEKVFAEDFTAIGQDILCDYIYNDLKNAEWSEDKEDSEKEYSIKIKDSAKLYDILEKHFKN